VVTFLFTDVEGWTRRWEADEDGMRKALATHDEVLSAVFDLGRRVKPCVSPDDPGSCHRIASRSRARPRIQRELAGR
jgi:hypothetical protein